VDTTVLIRLITRGIFVVPTDGELVKSEISGKNSQAYFAKIFKNLSENFNFGCIICI
jgi:hypothetical protein